MKIDFKDKKYLVTSGCSFTDGFWMKEKGSWAYYLSEMMGLELHNKARGGAGNEWISNSITTFLQNNEDIRKNCVVAVAWSDMSRLMHSFIDEESVRILDTVQPHDFMSKHQKGRFYEYAKFGEKFFSDIPYCVFKTYLAAQNLITFCERWDIPYFTTDALTQTKVKFKFSSDSGIEILHWYQPPLYFNLNDYPTDYYDVISPEWVNRIFKNHLKVMGCTTMMEFLSTDGEKYQKGNDGHPNDIASKLIAESIYEQII